MPTVYRIVPEGGQIDLEFDQLKAALPPTIELDSRRDGLYAIVESAEPEDSGTQWLIDRELDRIFFLSSVRLRAEMCRRVVTFKAKISYRIHGRIPDGTGPQQWTDRLSLQLRLWAIGVDSTDPYLKILLFFQIIELSYPDTSNTMYYPKYEGGSRPPHPRTEAKLLRHLISHAGDAKPETNKYLEFLGLPPRLSNLVHPDWSRAISERVAHVESQAREVLQSALL